MAEFNPKTGVDQGKEYDFRGTSGNRALGTLLSGVADIGNDAIGAVHRTIQTGIQQDARAGEETVQDNLFNTGKVATAVASTTKGGMAMPEDLNRGFKEALRLKNAYSKGAVRESDYLANIDVLAKKLRSKYGSLWSDEIDAAIGNAVSNTANSFRKQLFNEWDKEIADAKAKTDAAEKFVNQNLEHFAAYPEILANPTNYPMAQLRGIVAPRESAKWEVALAKSELELTQAGTELYDRRQERLLNRTVETSLMTLTDQGGRPLAQRIDEQIRLAGEDNNLSAEEDTALRNNINRYEAMGNQLVEQILTDPQFVDMDPAKKEAARKLIQDRTGVFRKAYADDHLGIMSLNARQFEMRAHDMIADKLRTNPNLANSMIWTKAYQDKGMAAFLNDELTQMVRNGHNLATRKGLGLAAQSWLGNDWINEYSEGLYNNPENAEDGGAGFLKGIEFTVKGLNSPNSPPEAKRAAALSLFNPDYRMFLRHFTNVPGDRTADQIYYSVVNPQTVKTMTELKGADQQLWFRFRTWAVDESFNVLFGQDIAQLSRYAEETTGPTNIKGKTLSYNSQKQMFEPPAEPKATARGADYAGARYRELVDSANRLNNWTRAIAPILKAEGLDVTNELTRIFQERGLMKIKGLEEENEEGSKKGDKEKTSQN